MSLRDKALSLCLIGLQAARKEHYPRVHGDFKHRDDPGIRFWGISNDNGICATGVVVISIVLHKIGAYR